MILNDLSSLLGIPIGLLIFVIVWSLFWKALALWKSARLSQPIWFVLLLVINTLGIFEILYIFLFSEIKLDEKSSNNFNKKKRKRIK